MTLDGTVVPVANISDAERDAMFALMESYYEHMDRSAFDADLDEKPWAILLRDEAYRIVGFSTQMLLDVVVAGRSVRALFSGDTIVARTHWAQNPLAQVWGRFALSLIDAAANVPLYWFLITKGYKTYRFLPVFFREFYPRHDRPTPGHISEVIDALASHKFPTAYDADNGLVRAGRFGCRLRPGVAEITSNRLGDPHVSYFCGRNPGHAAGDELCCIAPLTRANFTPAACRVIGPSPQPLSPGERGWGEGSAPSVSVVVS